MLTEGTADMIEELGGITRSGHSMTVRRDNLLAIRAAAQRRPAPRAITVGMVLVQLQARGLSLSLGEAEEIARLVLAAEHYRPSGGCSGLEG